MNNPNSKTGGISVKEKMRSRIAKLKATLKGKRAEGYVDTAVKMITAVVIGGLLLAGLYAMFNNVLFPGLAERIQVMFS